MSEQVDRWDDDAAAAIIGARVVIGVTYAGDGPMRQEQMHGTVLRATRNGTIDISLDGTRAGEVVSLPPDTAVFQPAAPGRYRLRATGKEVVDPDLTVTYTVHEGDGS